MGDLRLFDDLDKEIRDKKIILYGASGSGLKTLRRLSYIGIQPYAFCDGNSAKWGSMFQGFPVISPEELYFISAQEPDKIRVIICSVYLLDIYRQLIDKMSEEQIYSAFSMELALEFYVHRDNAACSPFFKEKTALMEKIWRTPEREDSYRFDNHLDKRRLLHLLDAEKEIVLAFSHAKIGTTTIFNSLKDQFFSLHFHDLEIWFGENGFLSDSPGLWREVMEYFKKRKKQIKIICGVREPISRDISGFFQSLAAYNNMLIADYQLSFLENIYEFLRQETTKICPQLPKKNYKEYGLRNLEYGRSFDWFNIELKKFFNIDIWKTDFDKDGGYQIYQRDNVEVFVYKLEKLTGLEMVLGEFLGVPDFQLVNENKSESKVYWKLYNDVKKEIILPQKYVDFYYKDNPCVDYFYTKEEQNQFLSKWKTE